MHIPKGPATDVLVVTQVLLWFGLFATGRQNWAFVELGFAPALISAALDSGDLGAIADAVLARPIAAAFLHAGFLHMLFNALFLLFAGRFVEGAMGTRSFAILFGAGIIAAAFADYVADPSSMVVSVGASGAIAGILAAYMLIYARIGGKPWGPIPAKWTRRLVLLGIWVAITLALGMSSNGGGTMRTIWSGIGGFVAGLLLTEPLMKSGFAQRRR